MAAIGPVALTAGKVAETLSGPYGMPVMDAVTAGALRYAFNLGGTFILAIVVDILAPTFSGQPNRVQGLKVAAYGTTPYWVGGAIALLPKLRWVGLLLGLYSVRLYALGVSAAMKTPADRATVYAAAVMVAAIVIALVSEALVLAFI